MMRPQVDDMYVSDLTPATLAKAVNIVREWDVMFLAVRLGRRAAIRLHHHLQRNPPTCEGCPLMEPRRGSLEELVWEGWCFSVPAIPYRKGANLGHSAFSSGIIRVRLDTGMPDGKACVVHTDYCQPHFFEGGGPNFAGDGSEATRVRTHVLDGQPAVRRTELALGCDTQRVRRIPMANLQGRRPIPDQRT